MSYQASTIDLTFVSGIAFFVYFAIIINEFLSHNTRNFENNISTLNICIAKLYEDIIFKILQGVSGQLLTTSFNTLRNVTNQNILISDHVLVLKSCTFTDKKIFKRPYASERSVCMILMHGMLSFEI